MRKIQVTDEAMRQRAIAIAQNAPLGIEATFGEPEKPRTLDQNALMWRGPLRDIEQQAWLCGRQYKADVWHEHFKREFLPEEYDEELCLKGYRKWDFTPTGERVLVGSTKKLKKKGFSLYMEQLYAFGAELGVMFSASPNEVSMVDFEQRRAA
jgi:hypothetical protein